MLHKDPMHASFVKELDFERQTIVGERPQSSLDMDIVYSGPVTSRPEANVSASTYVA